MHFPLELLLRGRDEPLAVRRNTPIRDVVRLMIEHDYSQTPVTDDQGYLSGIISEQTLVRFHYYANARVSFLDLDASHAEEPAVQLSIDDDVDVFAAMDRLRDTYAVVIVRDRKPCGIVTDYDLSHFLRSVAGDLLLIEDIEVALRRGIRAVLDSEQDLAAALFAAFRSDKKDPTKPARAFDHLDFGGHIQLITEDTNWQKFAPYYGPKPLFIELMGQVRAIRNQLAHFRGRTDPIQHEALERARDWLETRPEIVPRTTIPLVAIDQATVERLRGGQGEKYGPLQVLLAEQSPDWTIVRARFADIETLIGDHLPRGAYEHQSWWANDSLGHPQAHAWLQAGWRVQDVDLSAGEVVFHRADEAEGELSLSSQVADVEG